MQARSRFRPAWLFLAAAAIASLAGASLAAPLPVETVKIAKPTEAYEVDVRHPRTGLDAIDRAIARHVGEAVDALVETAEAEFAARAKAADRRSEWLTYSLYVRFDVDRNDDQMFVATLLVSRFTGGAHGSTRIETFNFLRPDGWRVYLPEILAGGPALHRISRIATADLKKQLGGPDAMSDAEWIERGAAPSWENFAAFVLLPETLVLTFQEYQVAAYAAGPQKAVIPLVALDGLMRPDRRLPAPSFDCAKARSRVEKAVCSDVALASLDREMAGAYLRRLAEKYAEDGTEVTDAMRRSLRQAQRRWLRHRDKACAGGAVACLSKVYQQRLAELKAAPSE